MNATDTRMQNTDYRARMFAHTVLAMVKDFIPYRNEREAAERLHRAALDQGFELTSKSMREQYESVMLHMAAIATVPPNSVERQAK